ncbi:pentapeptide repeat-containing protein [Paracidovorax anthurii]|uniref:Uncharacterized protein YjbI with pentapeptide repeats n=1 Tax=Paracidovorax anthurii TaxID=78229 RepID=A0A328ZEQ3_9BURK|nr:pentapeptide repeat-containing protein [Paracidovorax anthurii]RAR84780.1 uncharacterized protein YjbI with pentapeptide repeats [Paracidovorax anthurii]
MTSPTASARPSTHQGTAFHDESFTRERLAQCLAEETAPLLFERCRFEGVDMSHLTLAGCIFSECHLQDANLVACDLGASRWFHCDAARADFRSARADAAEFQACNLGNTRWQNAVIDDARFIESKLTGAHFGNVKGSGVVFNRSQLFAAHLRGMGFRKARIEEVNFAEADLSQCDFRQAVFVGGSLRDARVDNADFSLADLGATEISGLPLWNNPKFRKARISLAQAAALAEEGGLVVDI